jgi:hypothetical protein
MTEPFGHGDVMEYRYLITACQVPAFGSRSRSPLKLQPFKKVAREPRCRLTGWPADSDDVAQAYRSDVARRNELIAPTIPI